MECNIEMAVLSIGFAYGPEIAKRPELFRTSLSTILTCLWSLCAKVSSQKISSSRTNRYIGSCSPFPKGTCMDTLRLPLSVALPA